MIAWRDARHIIRLSRRARTAVVVGGGNTALEIVEGLAQRIVKGDVPVTLKNKKLVSLDLGSMIAGAKFRGEFENRLKAVLKEITEAAGNSILFIRRVTHIVADGRLMNRYARGEWLEWSQ